jgi:hypothetical protein
VSDDIERRLRDDLRGAELPGAPESLRAYRRSLVDVPRASSTRRSPRLWVLLPAAVLLIGAAAYIVGTQARVPPPTTPLPVVQGPTASTAAPPSLTTSVTTVDGIRVQSVSELLAARAAGEAKGGSYGLRGYWTDRQIGHSCVAPQGQPGELEVYCHDGEWGITERDEPILDANAMGRTKVAAGPHLTPYLNGLSGTS